MCACGRCAYNRLGALLAAEVGLEEREGKVEVVARGEHRPQRVELLHIGAVIVVRLKGARLAVELEVADRLATLRLEGEHVQQRRLAGARRAEDREHMARTHLGSDTFNKSLRPHAARAELAG